MSRTHIVKVQVPLMTNEPNPEQQYLVYGRGRYKWRQQGVSDSVKKTLGNDVKGYFEATFNHKTGKWDIYNRVGFQSW